MKKQAPLLPSEIMTANDVAEYLKVSPLTVYRLVKRGMIPGSRLATGGWRFMRAEIDQWIARRESGAIDDGTGGRGRRSR